MKWTIQKKKAREKKIHCCPFQLFVYCSLKTQPSPLAIVVLLGSLFNGSVPIII